MAVPETSRDERDERDERDALIAADRAILRALDELDEGLVVFRADRVLSVNDAFCRMAGRTRDEVVGSDVFQLVPDDERRALHAALQRYLEGEEVVDRLETTVIRADAARLDVELAVKATERAGRDTVLVAIVRDVTQARRESRFSRVLADASDVVAGATDDVEAIRAVARLVVPAIADWCAFDVQEADGSLRRIAAAHITREGEDLLWELDRRFPVQRFEGNLRARVLRSGTPLVMNMITDATIRATARNSTHAQMLRDLGLSAAMWVPAMSPGRTAGILSLGRVAQDRPFDDGDLDVVAKLGHRVAQAIERSTADRTIRARERQQAAVAELGRLALAGLTLRDLHQSAVNLVLDTLDVDFTASLGLRPDGREFTLLAGTGWSPQTHPGGTIGAQDATQAAYTLASGGPVLMEDIRTETRFAPPAFALELGIISGLSVVVAGHGERPFGVFSVHTKRRRRFDGDDVNFVRAVGNVLAAAIDRRQSEAALRESDQRLHLALAASQTGTWEWDLRTGALEWSDEILHLHGLPPGTPAPDFEEYLLMIHSDDRELFQQTVGIAINGGSYDLEFRIVRPDGSVRWTNGQGRVFTDEAGTPIRMVGTARDVTERKETEQERDRLLEQERTARLLREAFIGVLSHELRTPITTILGGSRLLVDRMGQMPAETAAELLSDIGEEAERLSRLVEDLLVLTRSERGNIDQRDDPVLPSMVVDTVVASSAPLRQRVTIDVQIPRNLPIIIGDETYLEQILRNLIGNAAKFSPPGSTVTITSEVTPREVILRILDEGPGVESKETDRLFEVFYRSPRTKTKAAGSGIGLFVARQLTAAMGGRIWAQQRPNGGAEFGLALRRHELPQDELDAAS